MELDLPEVTDWLPEHEPLYPLEIDAWIEREQALRYQLGQGRGCPFPSSDPFELVWGISERRLAGGPETMGSAFQESKSQG